MAHRHALPNDGSRPARRPLGWATLLGWSHALAALGFLSASGGARAADAPLVRASVSDVTTLDPHLLDVNHPTGSVIWSLFDSLVRRGPDGADLPRLATSWERISPTVWRFHLRHGVKFQDGEPLTAADVKFSFDRMSRPPFNAISQLQTQTALTQTRVIDDDTVELVTARPCTTMLYWLEEAFIVPHAYYSSHDKAFLNQHPVGSGPYRLAEWAPGDHVTLTANPDYAGGAPAFKSVEFRAVPELSARLDGLATGDIDLALELSPDTVGQADTSVSRAVSVMGLNKMHFGIAQHSTNLALRDPRVRRALNYALDVPTMARTIMGGRTVPLASVVNPPNSDPSLVPYGYHPNKARKLLAEAGYPHGFDLTISFTPFWGEDKEVSEAAAAYLQAVGITPHLEALEYSDFREKLSHAAFSGIFYAGWAELINPTVELVIFTCGQEDNASGYCDPAYDALERQIIATFDPVKRKALVDQAQEIVWNDAYWVFLWRAPILAGMSDRVDYKLRPDEYVELYLAKPKR